MSQIRQLLLRHEGLRLKPYKDTEGKLTIGVGRNLEDRGITKVEAEILLQNDLRLIETQIEENFPWFQTLDPCRQDVVTSMIFNLGLQGFMGFRKTIQAIVTKDYEKAAEEMLASKWAGQVTGRAHELAHMMRTGHYLKLEGNENV